MIIPDFSGKEFDDEKRFREELTTTLSNLLGEATGRISATEVAFPKGMIFYIVDDPTITIPKGFKIADGTNQTFNVSDKTLLPIQRI